MKIALDEHVPDGMVRVFESLATERKMRRLIGATGRGSDGGYTIVRSRQYNPQLHEPDYLRGSDAPWITRFAQDGGKVIVSGNVDMMAVPQEVLAMQRSGMIMFFFDAHWNHWNFFKKSSLLLWHWSLVIETAQTAQPGDVYRIPAAFREPGALNCVCRAGQLELLADSPHTTTKEMRKTRKKLSARRRNRASDTQGDLGLGRREIRPALDQVAPSDEANQKT